MLDDARVEYIFVLMLENRSFDQMLGFSNIQGTEVVTGTSPVIPSRVSVISTPSHTHPAALSTRVLDACGRASIPWLPSGAR